MAKSARLYNERDGESTLEIYTEVRKCSQQRHRHWIAARVLSLTLDKTPAAGRFVAAGRIEREMRGGDTGARVEAEVEWELDAAGKPERVRVRARTPPGSEQTFLAEGEVPVEICESR